MKAGGNKADDIPRFWWIGVWFCFGFGLVMMLALVSWLVVLLVFKWHLSSFCLALPKMINLNSEVSPDSGWALEVPQRTSKSGSG